MSINGCRSSLLLDHLLIPVGACLSAEVELPNSHPLRLLQNLRNLPNFAEVELSGGPKPSIWFNGLNRKAYLNPITSLDQKDGIRLVLEPHAKFDTSRTE